MNTDLYRAVSKAADKIGSIANQTTVLNLIESGRVNAEDTIYIDQAAPLADWDRLFVGSIQSLLSCDTHDRHVVAFFNKHGISA